MKNRWYRWAVIPVLAVMLFGCGDPGPGQQSRLCSTKTGRRLKVLGAVNRLCPRKN